MKVYVRVALLAALAATASAAGRCDAPFKTLSSDCRGASYDAKTLCLVIDQRGGGQPSPCATGALASQRTACAVYTGEQCDVLPYKVEYQSGVARFQIRFARDTARQLSDARATVAPSPLRRLLASAGSSSTAGGDAAGASPEPPSTTIEHVLRVDFPGTLAPTVPPTNTPGPKPTRVDLPATPSVPPSRGSSSASSDLPPNDNSGSAGSPVGPPTMGPPTDGPSAIPKPGPVTGYNGDGTAAAVESNQFVEAIGPLALDPSLKEVRIVGGASESGTRGKVAELRLDPQMLVQSPFVDSLWVANCNVGEQLAKGGFLSGMPSELTQLILHNTVLRSEPSDLSTLRNLQKLDLGQNLLATLSNKVSLPKLKSLDLSENTLTSMEAFVPAVESLYLNKNALTAIPSAVYSMKNLRELQLGDNPIYAIVTSTSQFDFLKKIHVTINKPPVMPQQPVVYVPGPLTGPLPADITNLVLSSRNADLSNAVAVNVGTLVYLNEVFPAWTLPDAIYEVFLAQQEMLAQSQIIVGGSKAEPYHVDVATAASAASAAEATSSGSQEDISPGSRSSTKAGSGAVNSTKNPPPLDSTTTSTQPAKSNTALIVSLVAAGVVAVLLVGLLVTRHRRRTNATAKADNDSVSALTTPRDGSSAASYQAVVTSKRSDRDSIEYFGALVATEDEVRVRDLFTSRRIRVSDLQDVRVVGSGTTSIVWLVRMRGSRDLASKRLIQSTSTATRMTKFVTEVVIAADLDHPSIIPLVGVAWTNETDLQALYEYMPNGDLQTYLHNNTPPDALSWSPEKLQMAIDIVEALVYTHSFNPPLVHRDLRTRNVLLDEHMRPKLTNFGSARFASEQNTMTTDGVGSARWLAPEILNGSTDYDHSSDMYALGVLLCELDMHAVPYEGVRDASGKLLSETAVTELVGRGELRPGLSATCPKEIVGIVSRCLSQDRASRPSAMQVAYELRLLRRDGDDVFSTGSNDGQARL